MTTAAAFSATFAFLPRALSTSETRLSTSETLDKGKKTMSGSAQHSVGREKPEYPVHDRVDLARACDETIVLDHEIRSMSKKKIS